jgi:hypothetical protein
MVGASFHSGTRPLIHSDLRVLMRYRMGALTVAQEDAANPWSRGFRALISYDDGHGEARK